MPMKYVYEHACVSLSKKDLFMKYLTKFFSVMKLCSSVCNSECMKIIGVTTYLECRKSNSLS